jgi:predicted nucleic acid-binding protein
LRYEGLNPIGLKAKERGILSNVRDILDAMVAENFRLSERLFRELLQQAGE